MMKYQYRPGKRDDAFFYRIVIRNEFRLHELDGRKGIIHGMMASWDAEIISLETQKITLGLSHDVPREFWVEAEKVAADVKANAAELLRTPTLELEHNLFGYVCENADYTWYVRIITNDAGTPVRYYIMGYDTATLQNYIATNPDKLEFRLRSIWHDHTNN